MLFSLPLTSRENDQSIINSKKKRGREVLQFWDEEKDPRSAWTKRAEGILTSDWENVFDPADLQAGASLVEIAHFLDAHGLTPYSIGQMPYKIISPHCIIERAAVIRTEFPRLKRTANGVRKAKLRLEAGKRVLLKRNISDFERQTRLNQLETSYRRQLQEIDTQLQDLQYADLLHDIFFTDKYPDKDLVGIPECHPETFAIACHISPLPSSTIDDKVERLADEHWDPTPEEMEAILHNYQMAPKGSGQ
jgi:hypothetical protein